MPDKRHRPARGAAHPAAHPDKLCQSCGRTFSWRKKWERDWENILYCSDACRSHRPTALDRALEAAILSLLAQRGRDKTICPSEAARLVADQPHRLDRSPPTNQPSWEDLMEPARAAARRLVAVGRIVITQQGQIVDPSTAKGPVRLRLR